MDVEALAAYLRIPRWSVYRLHAVGRQWRFPEAPMDAPLIAIGGRIWPVAANALPAIRPGA